MVISVYCSSSSRGPCRGMLLLSLLALLGIGFLSLSPHLQLPSDRVIGQKEHYSSTFQYDNNNNNLPRQIEPKQQQQQQAQQQQQQHPSSSSSSSSFTTATAAAAIEHVLARRQAYEDAGDLDRWRFRGVGYLYTHKGMVLAATTTSLSTTTTTSPQLGPGRNMVQIRDVMTEEDKTITSLWPFGGGGGGGHQVFRGEECNLLVMWVRVNGPEIFAGRAHAVVQTTNDAPCYWEFPFDLQEPGNYHVDVKLLSWHPNTIVKAFYNKGERNEEFADKIQCPFQKGRPSSSLSSSNNNASSDTRTTTTSTYPFHQGLKAFKLYDPVQSCCEICSRQAPYCKHWATPPDFFPKPSRNNNGCELYYSNETGMIPSSKLLPERQEQQSSSSSITVTTTTTKTKIRRLSLLPHHADRETESREHRRILRYFKAVPYYHGDPHSNPTTYFLGCGWSQFYTLDYPCLSGDLDDRVYLAQPNFTFEQPSKTKASSQQPLEKESTSAYGDDTKQQPQQQQQQQLPLCTLSHEALDSHKRGRWVRQAFPNSTVCPQPMTPDTNSNKYFDIMKFDASHPHCWHRDDLSRIGHKCIEDNCKYIPNTSKWISELHEEKEWYGVWKPYECDYVEFTNEQLQTCINKNKITRMNVDGASIAGILRQYISIRLQNITLYNGNGDGGGSAGRGRSVTISTLALVHRLPLPDDQHEAIIASYNRPKKQMQQQQTNESSSLLTSAVAAVEDNDEDDFYWVTGFFLSSERCTHCQVNRMDKLNHVANKTLQQGYKMINAFDMSAAFTYDTASQFDGLHIIGPPMKMMVTKIFHHMCKDTVSGSRLGGS